MATTGKIAEVLFENAIETYEHQDMILDKVDFWVPEAGSMQNADNFIWRSVQQHAPIITGFDISGQEQDIIEETYPAVLGVPNNDFVEQRADDMRTTLFWERRGKESGRQQATQLNKEVAAAIATQGTMYYRSNVTNGFAFIGEAQATMNERQGYHSQRCFMLNDRDTLKFATDLSAKQTLQGRPESDAWTKGQIGGNVAEFDVYTASFLPNLVGGAAIATTVTGNQSFAPEGGSVDATTGVVTNVDYRSAVIPVADETGYNVGDKVTIDNPGGSVQSIGLADKSPTGEAMTFTIIALGADSLTISPKPIALDDGSLTATEAAYANIDTIILNTATVERVNSDATAKTNLFWDRDAVEVIGGTIPAELFKQFAGMQVIQSTMSNGQEMYIIYDGQIDTLTFRFRIFTWYGITVKDPSRAGVAVSF